MTPTPSSVARAREIVDTSVHVWRSENDGRLEDARLYEYLYNAIALALDAQREVQREIDAQTCERVFKKAHTRASENADIYNAQDDTIERCAAAIRKGKD